MIPFNEDFEDLLLAMADADVEFLVVGGWAMALHGHGRSTDDIDVWVRANPNNADRVYRALLQFGAPVQSHGVTPEVFAQPHYGYRMGIKPRLIEVLTSVTGIDFEEAWQDRRHFTLKGRTIYFIGRSALLANKRAAGRPKDLADVAWLEQNTDEE